MKKRIFTIIILLLLFTGCTSKKHMAFYNDSDKALKSDNPIFLMTVTIRNSYKTSHQPKLYLVNIENETSNNHFYFAKDKKSIIKESDDPIEGNSYLLRMDLEAGSYIIRGVKCISKNFFVAGLFFAPIHIKIDAISGSGIFYLGHVDAIVREKTGNEFRAGSLFPLIDQAITGASGGTFDVKISDQWEKDEPAFRSKYTALKDVNINNLIPPPFDKEIAQQWWEEN